jgi:hypothetical protein
MTILLTALATLLLAFSITSRYWEIMIYDPRKVNDLLERNESMSMTEGLTITWLFQDNRVPQISFKNKIPPTVLYLLPIHSGVWVSCIDINGEWMFISCLVVDVPLNRQSTTVLSLVAPRASKIHTYILSKR